MTVWILMLVGAGFAGWAILNRIRDEQAIVRRGVNRDKFVEQFPPEDRDVAGAVFARLSRDRYGGRAVIPVGPSDDICAVHGVVDEDLDDMVLAVLAELGVGVPADPTAAEPVHTIADLILWISATRNPKA